MADPGDHTRRGLVKMDLDKDGRRRRPNAFPVFGLPLRSFIRYYLMKQFEIKKTVMHVEYVCPQIRRPTCHSVPIITNSIGNL